MAYTLHRLADDTARILIGVLVFGGGLAAVIAGVWALLYGIGGVVVWISPFVGSDPLEWAWILEPGYVSIGFGFLFSLAVFGPTAVVFLISMKVLGDEILRMLKERFGAH